MSMRKTINKPLLISLTVSTMLGGCASTNDPWADWNHGAQSFNRHVDKIVVKPLAKAYQWATPDIVDTGVTNFFSNINDIGVSVNDLLQFKILQGGMDTSRFLVNSTVGIAGLVDVASEFDLIKHHEDFGQTLAIWGLPSGPYLILPFFGSSSPRDTVGLVGDALLNPLTYISFFGGTAISAATAGSTVVDVADTRADALTTEKVVDEATDGDRYEFLKNAYQQRRDYLINDGNVPEDDSFDAEIDTDETGNSATSDSAAVTTSPINTSTPPADQQPKPAPVSKHFLDLSAPKENN